MVFTVDFVVKNLKSTVIENILFGQDFLLWLKLVDNAALVKVLLFLLLVQPFGFVKIGW